MMTIRCGNGAVEVHTELSDRADRNGRRHMVYVPDCCSARYASRKALTTSHLYRCPRDQQIEQLLANEGRSET
ncbi:MAG: hypothetical protein ACLQFR_16585 [Streptosporangiaceae bacterium]